MKIDYPQIDWDDVQHGDTILRQWQLNCVTSYAEFTVDLDTCGDPDPSIAFTHYLIDRPKPVFPEDYGTLIIAKKVRGVEFPEGITLVRQRGGWNEYTSQGPMWKSIDRRVEGKDNHSERQIEDWVLAKVVPA